MPPNSLFFLNLRKMSFYTLNITSFHTKAPNRKRMRA